MSELQGYFCPFGSLDIRAICKIGDDLDMHEGELFEIIDDFRESIGSESWDNIDPVYCVLDYVLQEARNRVSEITGYDFINDFSGA
ncbi:MULTISPECIES: hypothetical protein [unclassified Pseudoalteromonas]|uniref:hypothetical protein n=1 Tax=unclassified Pseudoalteromonas TaxID=194690 RepID=UPI001EF6D70F|nr:hypothetical protein [Pseudoalteromonas sp. Of7M-16]MCG7549029.1 hypothetical protein [Pseudoalteromonas sp. Of7M-16]